MRRAAEIIVALSIMVVAADAAAQTTPLPANDSTSAPASAPPKQSISSHSRYWFVGGVGFGASRAGCSVCNPDGMFSDGRSLLMDAGFRVNRRLDFGVEVAYSTSKFEQLDADAIPTTFVLGVVQVRPFDTRGFFFKTGMGAGILGSGLQGPIGQLEGTYTTNTLALVYGAGWVFRREQRFALQVHGTHHVAALGELTSNDSTLENVVGNYWNITFGIVFR